MYIVPYLTDIHLPLSVCHDGVANQSIIYCMRQLDRQTDREVTDFIHFPLHEHLTSPNSPITRVLANYSSNTGQILQDERTRLEYKEKLAIRSSQLLGGI